METCTGQTYNVTTDEDVDEIPVPRQRGQLVNIHVENARFDISGFTSNLWTCLLSVVCNTEFRGIDVSSIGLVRNVFVTSVPNSWLDVTLPTTEVGGGGSRHLVVFAEYDDDHPSGFARDSRVTFIDPDESIELLEVTRGYARLQNVTHAARVKGQESFSIVADAVDTIDHLELNATYLGAIDFGSLRTVGTLDMNIATAMNVTWDNVTVLESMEIGPSVPIPTDAYPDNKDYLNAITSIGGDLTIHGHPNTAFPFTGLTTVEGAIDIHDNSNSSFNFESLTKLTALSMVDNPMSELPGDFLRLEEADNIHLNGILSTCVDPNLAPPPLEFPHERLALTGRTAHSAPTSSLH